MLILAIESSCDDTSICIYNTIKKNFFLKTYNQKKINEMYGGTIPEITSRNHSNNIIQITKIIKKKIKKIDNIKLIFFTNGPGLTSSLLIGTSYSKSLGYLLKIKTIPINHIEAHILSTFINKKKIIFPFLSLIISGGHTFIFKCDLFKKYEIIGQTKDDSIGECLDKIARELKLKNPNGKTVEKLAKNHINNNKIKFIKLNKKINNLNFSFSGLKTSIKNYIKKNIIIDKSLIAYSLQYEIIKIIINKIENAINKTNIKKITIGGGVSSNKYFKQKMKKIKKKYKAKIYYPKIKLCTDNAAMIGYLGYLYIKNKEYFKKNLKINIIPKLIKKRLTNDN